MVERTPTHLWFVSCVTLLVPLQGSMGSKVNFILAYGGWSGEMGVLTFCRICEWEMTTRPRGKSQLTVTTG